MMEKSINYSSNLFEYALFCRNNLSELSGAAIWLNII